MKLPIYYCLFAVMIAFSGCASKKTSDTATTVSSTRQDIVASKEAEVTALERRLDTMRDESHSMKFRGANNEARKNLNDRYSDLAVAKAELNVLRNAIDSSDFYDKQASLDASIASLTAKLDNKRIAE